MSCAHVLYLTHPASACGVYEFGKLVYNAVSRIADCQVAYAEVNSRSEAAAAIAQHSPKIVLVNYHPIATSFWPPSPGDDDGIISVGILHEMNSEYLDELVFLPFDYFMVHDPTVIAEDGRIYTSARPLPQPIDDDSSAPPTRLTIGSFGFAIGGKGFEALVARVQLEFDDCHIRLNIPYSSFCDSGGQEARAVADRCRSLLWNPGVTLEISHDYLEPVQLLRFLRGNSMNAFFYEPQRSRGLSSALDWALVAGRPIALRKAEMFRHLFGTHPSVFVEERSMGDILGDDNGWQLRLVQEWSTARIAADYEFMFTRLLQRHFTTFGGRDASILKRALLKTKEGLDKTKAELDRTNAEVASLSSRLAESEGAVQAIYRSTLWRLTTPLRWIRKNPRVPTHE